MWPMIQLGSWSIGSYVVFLGLGVIAGSTMARERGLRDGLRTSEVLAPAFAAVVLGVVGARFWSAIVEAWPLMGSAAIGSHLLASSGLSVFGGLLLGAVGAALSAWRLRVPVLAWTDAAVPGLALGYAFGRFGCLAAGCCYGTPTLFPVALVFTDHDTAARPLGVPLHATQLYASVGAVLLAIALWRVPSTPRGTRTAWYFLLYGVLRLAIEPLRGDYRGRLLGLPSTAIAAALLIVLGGAGLWMILRSRSTSADQARDASDP